MPLHRSVPLQLSKSQPRQRGAKVVPYKMANDWQPYSQQDPSTPLRMFLPARAPGARFGHPAMTFAGSLDPAVRAVKQVG